MIIELRKKSQITLPKEIITKLNLKEGDCLEVSLENGSIKLEPVAIYKKDYIQQLTEEVRILKEDSTFDEKSFYNVDELLKKLNNGE